MGKLDQLKRSYQSTSQLVAQQSESTWETVVVNPADAIFAPGDMVEPAVKPAEEQLTVGVERSTSGGSTPVSGILGTVGAANIEKAEKPTLPVANASTLVVNLKTSDVNLKGEAMPAPPLTCLGGSARQVAVSRFILRRIVLGTQPINFFELSGLSSTKDLQPIHYTIICVAVLLKRVRALGYDLCENSNNFYLFNKHHWVRVEKDIITSVLGNVAARTGMDPFLAEDYSFAKRLTNQLKGAAFLPRPYADQREVKINLFNGTFVIRAGVFSLRPHDRRDFFTYRLPFAYDPAAAAPLFKAFLQDVLPDPTCQDILAEYLGYVFLPSGLLKMEKVLALFGTGANGKSVVYEVICALLGHHNITSYSIRELTDDSGYSRANLQDVLLNYSSEANHIHDTEHFKKLASGEPIGVRLPYKEPTIMTNYAKLMFNCNELPKDVENTDAYFRRFIILPFVVRIPDEKQDRELARKIVDAELSGVFNWVLEGLQRLLQNKRFTESCTVKELLETYRKESDSVRLFLDESDFIPAEKESKPLQELYSAYSKFCEEDNYKRLSKINFKRRLVDTGIKVTKRAQGLAVFVKMKGEGVPSVTPVMRKHWC